MSELPTRHLGAQFNTLEQQTEASSFGMWLFLGTEVLFFGGLFLAYTVYRHAYPDVFEAAGHKLNLTIGTINTGVLLTSSYLMALAVHAARSDRSRRAAHFLAGTWVLGFLFICLKAYEYADDIQKHLVPTVNIAYVGPQPGVARLMYFIYYCMTGLHAVHMTIGLGLVAWVYLRALRSEFNRDYYAPVEIVGLYWHFVDLIWIFLYPLLYLMDRHI